ncbi:MAG: Uma2 family endonuclease [Rhodothermales bacterium]|jgi:Uma2 family endonuclease
MQTAVAPSRITPHRFTIEDYLRMGEAGILSPEDRVELTHGQVVSMSPIGNWHSAAVERLSRFLHDQIREPWRVVVQSGLNIGDDTQLVPDLSVAGPEA